MYEQIVHSPLPQEGFAMNIYDRYPNRTQSEIEREKLERLFDQSKALHYQKSRLLLGLKRIGLFLLKALTAGDEPRIWLNSNSAEKRWCAYDPTTNRSASFDSEAELRVWLEQRYYQ